MHQNIIVKNLTLAETIAHRNPEIANELLIKNGYPASRDRAELARRLNSFLLTQRDHALKQLAAIHPDRDLMFDNFQDEFANAEGEENPGRHLAKGKGKGLQKRHHRADGDDHYNCCGNADGDYSNCAGCGGACAMKQNYMNASGDAAKQAAIPALMNRETIAIVGLIALASIALIAVTKSKS